MAMNRTQAGKLLNIREMELFETTLSAQLRGVASKDLQKRIARVRTQRDKQADLLRRQRLATRQRTGSKSGPQGDANERTQLKEQLFNEALARLEAQHAKAEAAEQREAQRAARAQAKGKVAGKAGAQAERQPAGPRGAERSAKAPARSPGAGSAAGPAGQAPLALAKGKRLQEAGVQRVQGHMKSAGRRAQGARDQRG